MHICIGAHMTALHQPWPGVALSPHASHEPFVSELTVRCVRRCCRSRAGSRQAALYFFYYHIEGCFHDLGATRADCTLHADNISTSYTHTSALYSVSQPRPPAMWPLCSWLEVEDELNSTPTSGPSVRVRVRVSVGPLLQLHLLP